MTSPPGAPGPGGRQQQRPKPKSGLPDGGTTGRRELARHARFAEISPEVGVLDERAMSQALADDPAAFELLAAMTTATDENLRAAAIRLSASIVLERARAGRPSMRGISRLRPVRGATDGDLDIDASVEGVSAARSEARPVVADDLTTVQWAKAHTAFAVVVDRSGSMSGTRLAAAATVAAACALRAPQEHAVLSFAGSVETIRPLVSEIPPAVVAERLLRMRGHGVTRLAAALKAAGEQLAPARPAAGWSSCCPTAAAPTKTTRCQPPVPCRSWSSWPRPATASRPRTWPAWPAPAGARSSTRWTPRRPSTSCSRPGSPPDPPPRGRPLIPNDPGSCPAAGPGLSRAVSSGPSRPAASAAPPRARRAGRA